MVMRSAFAPRRSTLLSANIMQTLKTLQGPGIVWGSAGVPLGHEENEIKGYDNFDQLVKFIEAAGLADALAGGGPYTVFAPVNSAFEGVNSVSGDALRYHVVPGKFTYSQIDKDLPTALQGKSLAYSRKFRKTFVNDAIVGQEDNFGGGSKFPTDIICDNGVIHAISTILEPN